MSIQVSRFNSINYNFNSNSNNTTNNSSKTNEKNFNDILSSETTGKDDFSKLDDEDKRLYQDLKNAGVDLIHHTLDEQKHLIKTLGFPPLTAPSYVRQAWREMLGNMSSGQREIFQDNIANLMAALRSKMGVDIAGMDQKMSNPKFSYSNFADDMLSMSGCLPGFDSATVSSSLADFKKKLESNKQNNY